MLARGLVPPKLGSFRDELLRELDERSKNLRFTEVAFFAKVLMLLLDGDKHAATITELLREYSAELYQDVYTPDWQLEQRAALQRKREKARADALEKSRLLTKVSQF